MVWLLCVILLQVPKQGGTELTTPQTSSVPQQVTPSKPAASVQQLTAPAPSSLSPDTQLHLAMEHELGGQQVALGELKAKVEELKEKREHTDRPDIDSLKSSRLYVGWAASFLGIGLILVGYYKRFLWTAILPWLREELRGNRHPSTSETLNLTDL
jgi:hypothetical protein